MLTLIEQAEKTFDQDEAEKLAAKLTTGNQFTLEDFLGQLQAIRRMGPISNLLGMMPGMGQMKEAISQVDDRDLDRTAAIIHGMTPAERENPKIINGSRRLRIANGSGVAVSEVNQLVDRFFEARKMMQQMGGAMGLPGARRKNTKQKGRKGKKGRGRGPTAPRMPSGMQGMPGMPGNFGGLPAQLPPGTKLPDLSKLNLPDS
jgi:signal recognition particle subunit SRP54